MEEPLEDSDLIDFEQQLDLASKEIQITETTRRKWHVVTLVEGIDGKDLNPKEVTKKLKSVCAAGGSYKDGTIMIQGSHSRKIKQHLSEEYGIPSENIEIS